MSSRIADTPVPPRCDAMIPLAEGILFCTYATLRSPSRQVKLSRLDQIVEWLAGSLDEEGRHAFDGVIVFDEAHAMANAAGSKSERGEVKPSQQGRAGLRLQNALPDARIAYVSATGATTVPGLAYAGRLGLWAAGETPFGTRVEFVSAMEAGGVAAMEVAHTDISMRLGAAGARGVLLEADEGGGIDLALRGDAFLVQMESVKAANTVATKADASRLRLVLECWRAAARSRSARARC